MSLKNTCSRASSLTWQGHKGVEQCAFEVWSCCLHPNRHLLWKSSLGGIEAKQSSSHIHTHHGRERQEGPLYEISSSEVYFRYQKEIRDKDLALCCALALK